MNFKFKRFFTMFRNNPVIMSAKQKNETDLQFDKREYRRILDCISKEQCHGCDCILKELLIRTHDYNERFLIQLKCVEIFKYEESEREHKDIGWDEALTRWAFNGWAKEFAAQYKHGIDYRSLYNILLSEVNKQK